MNIIQRAALRFTLALIDVSLGNHQPVNVEDDQGPVCASCRPLQAWPCEHFHHLTERRQVIEDTLEPAAQPMNTGENL